MSSVNNPIPNFDYWRNQAVYESVDHDEFKQMLDYIDAPANTQYIDIPKTRDLMLVGIGFPMDVAQLVADYGLNERHTDEAANVGGSHLALIVTDGSGESLPAKVAINLCCDTAAWPSLLNAAKLYGSALQRMDPVDMAKVLNYGLNVAQGGSLMLKRFGKCFAVHSDTYVPMPISSLFDATEEIVTKNLGKMTFVRGYYQHNITTVHWNLADSSNGIMDSFERTLSGSGVKLSYGDQLTAGVMLTSSDTQSSAGRLIPVLTTPYGGIIRMADEVAVRHEKQRGDKQGLALFKEGVEDIYAIFVGAAEKLADLAKVTIKYPGNCLVELGKKFDIGKRYISAAYEELTDELGEAPCTAYDIVLVLSNIAVTAGDQSGSQSFILDIQEKVSKVTRIQDWGAFDLAVV